jgi:hypothetical protein
MFRSGDMKGTIVKCMQELVTSKFGADKWKESLRKAGVSESHYFSTTEDVDDAVVLEVMKCIAGVTALSMDKVMDAFGEYWCTVYAPDIYGVYFNKSKSTRELLLSLDQIHVAMTKSMKSAMPPHFTYEWKNDKTLVMHYESKRGLVALMPGLIRGLGKYYKDDPRVNLAGNNIEVTFR